MLTTKHINLLRAALQFFAEELCPHGARAIEGYASGATPEDVDDLQTLFANCEIVEVDREHRLVTLQFATQA